MALFAGLKSPTKKRNICKEFKKALFQREGCDHNQSIFSNIKTKAYNSPLTTFWAYLLAIPLNQSLCVLGQPSGFWKRNGIHFASLLGKGGRRADEAPRRRCNTKASQNKTLRSWMQYPYFLHRHWSPRLEVSTNIAALVKIVGKRYHYIAIRYFCQRFQQA